MKQCDTQHKWRHDIEHKDTQHNVIQCNGTQHNDVKHNDIRHKDMQYNDTQLIELICDTQHKWHSAYIRFCMKCHYAECRNLFIVMLNVVTTCAVMLSIVILSVHTHHKNTYCLVPLCWDSICWVSLGWVSFFYAECHNTWCSYAKCHGTLLKPFLVWVTVLSNKLECLTLVMVVELVVCKFSLHTCLIVSPHLVQF
jgi:hypothetical protein